MTITFRHPQTSPHHTWQWLAAGSAAVLLSAGAYTGIRALTSSDTSTQAPAGPNSVDSTGLGAILSTNVPSTPAYVDATGLGAILSTNVPSQATYVDATGLGAILSTNVPSQATYVDATGLGPILSTNVPSQATYVDATGLGPILSTNVPSQATYVDATGLGPILSTNVPSQATYVDATGTRADPVHQRAVAGLCRFVRSRRHLRRPVPDVGRLRRLDRPRPGALGGVPRRLSADQYGSDALDGRDGPAAEGNPSRTPRPVGSTHRPRHADHAVRSKATRSTTTPSATSRPEPSQPGTHRTRPVPTARRPPRPRRSFVRSLAKSPGERC